MNLPDGSTPSNGTRGVEGGPIFPTGCNCSMRESSRRPEDRGPEGRLRSASLHSITGGIQPGTFAKLATSETYESGLMARFLLAYPDRQPKSWTDEEISGDAMDGWTELVRRLYELPIEAIGDNFYPDRRRLSREGKKAWIAFYNAWAKEQADVQGELAACYSKMEAYAARLALIHHVATCVEAGQSDDCEVGEESVKAGVALAR